MNGTMLTAHQVLGLTQKEYADEVTKPGGVSCIFHPNWHSHPVHGITGHLHPDGREPHIHRPTVEWDLDHPLPIVNEGAGVAP